MGKMGSTTKMKKKRRLHFLSKKTFPITSDRHQIGVLMISGGTEVNLLEFAYYKKRNWETFPVIKATILQESTSICVQ